jgi:hypothetical protein
MYDTDPNSKSRDNRDELMSEIVKSTLLIMDCETASGFMGNASGMADPGVMGAKRARMN